LYACAPTNQTAAFFSIRQGNATFVPGAPLRDDFMQYFFDHAHVKDYIAGVANASYAVPDLPSTWFTAQYIADRGLRYPREREAEKQTHSEKSSGACQGKERYLAFPLPTSKTWNKTFAACDSSDNVWNSI
jgi:hypothetical protein